MLSGCSLTLTQIALKIYEGVREIRQLELNKLLPHFRFSSSGLPEQTFECVPGSSTPDSSTPYSSTPNSSTQ